LPHTEIWYTLLAAAKRKVTPFSFLSRKGIMNKIFLLFFLSITLLFGVELRILPQQNIQITGQDVDAFKKYILDTLHFHLSDEGAQNIVLENRFLANDYIKTYKLAPFDKKYLQVMVEKFLADKMVQRYQENLPIDEKVLLSYYLDHKKEFKKQPQIEAILFWFDDAKKAIDFYLEVQGKDFEDAKKLARKYGGVLQKMGGEKSLSQFSQKVQKFVHKNPRPYYAMPPVILSPNSASVLYIKSYRQERGYEPFDAVKEKVKRKIFQEAFTKMRKEILNKYKRQ